MPPEKSLLPLHTPFSKNRRTGGCWSQRPEINGITHVVTKRCQLSCDKMRAGLFFVGRIQEIHPDDFARKISRSAGQKRAGVPINMQHLVSRLVSETLQFMAIWRAQIMFGHLTYVAIPGGRIASCETSSALHYGRCKSARPVVAWCSDDNIWCQLSGAADHIHRHEVCERRQGMSAPRI